MKAKGFSHYHPLWVLPVCVLGCVLAILLKSHDHFAGKTENESQQPAADSVRTSTALPRSTTHKFHQRALVIASGRRPPIDTMALAQPDSPEQSQDLEKNREWTRNNPAAAVAWAMSAAEGPQRDTVVETVCPQLAQEDPAQAVDLAERAGSGCSNLLENMAMLWAQREERSAYEWAANKPDGEERDRLLGRIAFVESKSNPAEAARLVAEEISPGSVQEEAAVSVVYQWALQDRNAAKTWAQSFPPGSLRDRAIREVENVAGAGGS
jgi:hypothetical protein